MNLRTLMTQEMNPQPKPKNLRPGNQKPRQRRKQGVAPPRQRRRPLPRKNPSQPPSRPKQKRHEQKQLQARWKMRPCHQQMILLVTLRIKQLKRFQKDPPARSVGPREPGERQQAKEQARQSPRERARVPGGDAGTASMAKRKPVQVTTIQRTLRLMTAKKGTVGNQLHTIVQKNKPYRKVWMRSRQRPKAKRWPSCLKFMIFFSFVVCFLGGYIYIYINIIWFLFDILYLFRCIVYLRSFDIKYQLIYLYIINLYI